MDTITNLNLAHLRALHAAATEGEWEGDVLQVCTDDIVCCMGPTRDLLRSRKDWPANAAFIAAIHNAFPALADRLEAAERERDEWRAQLKRVVGEHSRPNDCYATGPLTGDPIRDLIACPSCEAIAMELAAQKRQDKQEAARLRREAGE